MPRGKLKKSTGMITLQHRNSGPVHTGPRIPCPPPRGGGPGCPRPGRCFLGLRSCLLSGSSERTDVGAALEPTLAFTVAPTLSPPGMSAVPVGQNVPL
ncbi:unnamed protein product, partial [Rangifer tarandus platyrhynchus]